MSTIQKTLASWLLCAGLLSVGTGCSRDARLDTTSVEQAFQLVQGEQRPEVDEAVRLVKDGDYPRALRILREVKEKYRLSTEQIMALQEILPQLERRAAAASPTPEVPAGTNAPGLSR